MIAQDDDAGVELFAAALDHFLNVGVELFEGAQGEAVWTFSVGAQVVKAELDENQVRLVAGDAFLELCFGGGGGHAADAHVDDLHGTAGVDADVVDEFRAVGPAGGGDGIAPDDDDEGVCDGGGGFGVEVVAHGR